MPIAGLTDRASVRPRFTDLGKIRKGTKDKQGDMIDLSYFRFIGASPEIQAAFETVYGQEPQAIRILLPYRTMEENWDTSMEEWGESGLIHRCNGVLMTQWLRLPEKTYERDSEMLQQKPCPYASGEKKRTKKTPGCKRVGYLSVMIPELLEIGHFGYVTVETHSINDLANITASILQAEDAARGGGSPRLLQGIEFIMRRVEENIGVRWQGQDGAYRKTRQPKWMIRLDPAQEWALRMIEQARSEALALPAQAGGVVIEGEVIGDEPVNKQLVAALGITLDEDEFPPEAAQEELPEPTTEVPEAPEPEEDAPESPAPPVDVDFEELQTLPFMTEYGDLDKEQLKGYVAHICSTLIGIGYGVKTHRANLLTQMFETADFQQYVLGWFRLLEQYGLHVYNSKERGKAKEYAKRVVAIGVAHQIDWFGAVELLEETDNAEEEEIPY